MRFRRVCAAVIAVLALTWTMAGTPHAAASQASPPAALPGAVSGPPSPRAIIDKYCVTCHNRRLKTAGLMLDTLDLGQIRADGAVWEKVVRKLRTGAMPPAGSPRPDPAAYNGVASALEAALDRAAEIAPSPGRPLPHRMNRTEYANAIRDLLGLDVDVSSLLPRDDASAGFDNIADVLGVSPVLLERYLSAAGEISALAVGDRDTQPADATYRVRQDLSQDQHIEGLPFGTTGGMVVRHTFSLDGEYVFQVKLLRTNLDAMRGLEYPRQVEVTVDGERVLLGSIGGTDDLLAIFPARAGEESRAKPASDAIDARLRVRAPVKAGPRAVGVAFIEKSALGTARLQPFLKSAADTFDFTALPQISTLTITGPFNATGAGDTPSRRRLFVCHPGNAADEAPCAKRIISTLARRAYRHPVTSAELRAILQFYDVGRMDGGSFDAGIQAALQRVLASPKFVFRVEHDPAHVPPGTIYRINDFDLASRLSFFLWSSIPDDELLELAARGELQKPAVLERQVRRMLADPRAQSLMTNFAGQWLQLRNLSNIVPNSDRFPNFDDNLRDAFRRETELFFGSIMREDRSVLDFLTADYTFVNERLARHYGIPDVYGSRFRRVTITDDARKGLLGQGSILTVTSQATRTSPVLRGKWILENLLGTPPPPPPPNVPALKENEAGQTPKTVREQLAEHRNNPTCASCHRLMDPLGFALENFDAVGTWRTVEAGTPIDASGVLADGSKVDGVVALRKALLGRPNVFAGTLTEKLLTYALGRGLDYHDMPAVRAIVHESARNNYRFSSIVQGIVGSVPFQMRLTPPLDVDAPPIATAARRDE